MNTDICYKKLSPNIYLNNKAYEQIARDMINCSEYFLKLSHNQLYRAPKSESNGESDCITDSYELDFKRIGSKSYFTARNTLELKEYVKASGISFIGRDNIKKSKSVVVNIENVLKDAELEFENCAIKSFKLQTEKNLTRLQHNMILKELNIFLNIFKHKKNIMLLSQYQFITNNSNFGCRHLACQLNETLNKEYKNAIEFRKKYYNKYHNYIGYFFDKKFIISKFENNKLNIISITDAQKSNKYNEYINKEHLIVIEHK